MRQAGVEIRPIREINGHSMFNDVFLDDAWVPDEYRLGALGQGWELADLTLSVERASIAASPAMTPAMPGELTGTASRAAPTSSSSRSTPTRWGWSPRRPSRRSSGSPPATVSTTSESGATSSSWRSCRRSGSKTSPCQGRPRCHRRRTQHRQDPLQLRPAARPRPGRPDPGSRGGAAAPDPRGGVGARTAVLRARAVHASRRRMRSSATSSPSVSSDCRARPTRPAPSRFATLPPVRSLAERTGRGRTDEPA